ncbi:hypothetical protein HRG_010101 [Hirsutella rhossiliensis]|uniref:Uncharacterized protein n=1 Tax=Hirsutella rhossiliensis TaxID=111463 RepID=A0A9P8SDX0_9HYPO|nr:uncharacterized protein HRG_10101 [Hirsutella rhossiliensis]KAH0959056.1 hypothetical protein HRG_10101 [Hirsutella rhossiliensis]
MGPKDHRRVCCTREDMKSPRTKPFMPFKEAFWNLQPWFLKKLYRDRPDAFYKGASKQEKARAKISEREARLKKKAMKVLYSRMIAEESVEDEQAGAAEAEEPAKLGKKLPDGKNQTKGKTINAFDYLDEDSPLAGEQIRELRNKMLTAEATAAEPTKLREERKEALMRAIESQTPEEVEEASRFLAQVAKVMAASRGEPVNVFDYLDPDSPPADEQIRELQDKILAAEVLVQGSAGSAAASSLSLMELARVLETPLIIDSADAKSEEGFDAVSYASGPGSKSAVSKNSSSSHGKSSKHSTPGPSSPAAKSVSSRYSSKSSKHSLVLSELCISTLQQVEQAPPSTYPYSGQLFALAPNSSSRHSKSSTRHSKEGKSKGKEKESLSHAS